MEKRRKGGSSYYLPYNKSIEANKIITKNV